MLELGIGHLAPNRQAPGKGSIYLLVFRRKRSPDPLLERTLAAPSGQAAAFEAALKEQIVQFLGAIPLLLPFFERLGLRQIVNRHIGPTEAEHDPGLVVLILGINRLLAPRPMVHVEGWLDKTALPEILGVCADQFNDDRLARTLDLLAPHLEAVWQELVIAAILEFDLDLSQLCYDITSIAFTGDYDQAELVRYGYSRDHRPDLKQVELAVNVTADSGVPVDYRVLAGNIADRTTPVENLTRLRQLLERLPQVDPSRPPVKPLLISDRAMLTPESMAEYCRHEVSFLGPYDAGEAGRQLLRGVSAQELGENPLAYRPQRAERDQSFQPNQGVLRPLEVEHPEPGQPPLQLQGLVVFSPGKARLDAQLRETNLARLEAKLAGLAAKLNRRPYTKYETVEKRLKTVLNHHAARPFLAVSLEDQEGSLFLTWQRQEEAIAWAAELDGRYLLITNDFALDANTMLTLSKRRDVPEKRFSTVKGPLRVRPVYVHKQERVLGLVFCTLVALLVYALLELECKRASVPRSGTALFQEFASISVVVTRFPDGTVLRRQSDLEPKQTALLEALGLPTNGYSISRC